MIFNYLHTFLFLRKNGVYPLMKKTFSYLFLLNLLFNPKSLWAQESDSSVVEKVKKWQLHGYLKNMETMSFTNLNQVNLDNLIHNRLNFKVQLKPKITGVVEIRNRILFGDQVSNTPAYGTNLAMDKGLMDLSWSYVDKKSFVMNTTIDRLYVDFTGNNIEARIGRQRINWGITMAWNPNDWFNTYNYFDFDYEERPGSDAVRTRIYFRDGMSSLDMAGSLNKNRKNVSAVMYKFNTHGYDIQFLSGKYYSDFAFGAGWAGSIKNAGFKGELSYFKPFDKTNSQEAFVATSSLDYSFKNSIYLSAAWLYSSLGINQNINLNGAELGISTFGNLTAKSLFPTKNTSMLVGSYPISPLWNVSLAGIYGYGMNIAFFSPSLTYSLRDDVDLYLIGQSFYLQQGKKMENLGNGAYFRLKWSF